MQRYAKLPVIDDSFLASTCIAFDLMTANLADLPAMPRLLPALQVLLLSGKLVLSDNLHLTPFDSSLVSSDTCVSR